MTLEVTKRYVDKYSHETVEAGTILQNVPDGRAEELVNSDVAMIIGDDEPVEETSEDEPVEEPIDPRDLMTF